MPSIRANLVSVMLNYTTKTLVLGRGIKFEEI